MSDLKNGDLMSMVVMLVRRLVIDLIFDEDPLIVLVAADLDFYPQDSIEHN